MDNFILISGNKNQSSWSLRAWLMMKIANANFKVKFIDLSTSDYKEQILRYSPSGKVPALIHNDLVICDSLAIGEYLNELFPNANLYPNTVKERAIARSIASEIHAGFTKIRSTMPFRLDYVGKYDDSLTLQQELNRIEEIWSLQRNLYQEKGDFLFGKFCLIDAMFAPIVIRFAKYGYIPDSISARQYCKSILEHKFVKEWIM